MVVLMLILLLPSLEGLKWGEIEIKLAPAEVSPEIHVAPIDPTSALEVVLRSVRTAPSPVAFTRAPTTASRGTAVTGVVDLAKATLITTTRNGQP